MNVRSLGRQTDFIFSRFAGSVEDKGPYVVIKTPSNPGYHWGNYILFDRPPRRGDLLEWKSLFDKEFPDYIEPHHYTFTWETDPETNGNYQEFLADGFEFESAVILTANQLNQPKHLNNEVSIKKIETKQEWEDVIQLQILCADKRFLNEGYKSFKRNQMQHYQEMKHAGLGNWFGAYIGEKLVGDLGVFCQEKLARFQNVGTHPQFRHQGICGTLVYMAGQVALREYGVETLVMEADAEYHAARIYESVGFEKSEINYSLSWWRK